MTRAPQLFHVEDLPDDFGHGPDAARLEQAAKPNTVQRIAQMVRDYDGTNSEDIAKRICGMIFEGEPLEE